MWAKMARTRCPIREARWPKEWFFGEVTWTSCPIRGSRQSLLWCQEGMVLERPQPGGLSFVFGPRGRKALRVFGESPKRGQDVRMVSKGKGWGVPSQGGPGSHGKGMLVRLVGESPTFLHANLTLRADPAVSAQSEKKMKRPSTVTRVRASHTTRAMRAFKQTPDMTCHFRSPQFVAKPALAESL